MGDKLSTGVITEDEKELSVIAKCIKGLDYNLQTAQERIDLVNSLLSDENTDNYFMDIFDEDLYKKSLKSKEESNQKYINLLPSTSQLLSHDIYECKGLERISNYILFAPNQPKMNKQQEYSFYDESGFKRLIKKEKLYEDIIDKYQNNDDGNDLDRSEILNILGDSNVFKGNNHFSIQRINKANYINKDKKLAFLKRKENYKLDGKCRITKKDLKDEDLAYVKKLEKEIEKIQDSIKRGNMDGQTHIAKNMIGTLRDAQIQYKNYKKGTIIFKQPLKDDGRVDYEEFDFFDKKHVLALINMPKRQVCDEDLPLLIYDLEVLMKSIKIKEEDNEIIKLYQRGLSQQEIADELGIAQQGVNQVLNRLANSVIQEYERIYEDWYYLNKVKGKYKKCSRCGEIKLTNKFGKDSRISDGLKSFCKKCDK